MGAEVTAGPLAGRVAVVTGAVRGIGLGIAQRLARDGARVAIWDRDLAPFDASTIGFAPAARPQA
ncbi:MAG TPA: SDR family NAD(P)-dependent oxidoreductase, partial [Casimicrobiaceae bacterium]|nr:SDR family NAD(P)-dependent oxidoreductase [Casimicrobiaceae bacterium]